jgi:hypothetical protein
MKLLPAVLVACGALGAVTSASADTPAVPTSSPCYLEKQALEKNGFVEGAAYSADGIQQLLKQNGTIVNLSKWDSWKPRAMYKVTYSCYVDHGIVHPALTARTVVRERNAETGKHYYKMYRSTLRWDFTSPLSE